MNSDRTGPVNLPVGVAGLVRLRWAVRAVLLLGVGASITANVLHAQDNAISQAVAAWPPVALLVTVELMARVPVHRRRLAWLRMGAAGIIAAIAAWVSYWHMAAVAARYGETGVSAYLLPLSVDGLIVVASVCLVELAGRIHAATQPGSTTPDRTELAGTQASETETSGTETSGTPDVATAAGPAVESGQSATGVPERRRVPGPVVVRR